MTYHNSYQRVIQEQLAIKLQRILEVKSYNFDEIDDIHRPTKEDKLAALELAKKAIEGG